MAVITISRQVGSGGDEIASRLCELLGYQQFDKRLIVQAAAETGLSEQEIAAWPADYSEENYKVRGFLDRLFNRAPAVGQVRVWRESPTGERVVEESTLSEEAVLSLVQNAVRSAHRAGRLVIVGRGGQILLKDYPDVLHVRIEAPLEERIQRVKDEMRASRQAFHADIELRRDAQDWVSERDAGSAGYIRHFYHADWADPLLYHLVINTGKLPIARAVELIAKAAAELPAAEELPSPAAPRPVQG
jgi:cytidylate kinase